MIDNTIQEIIQAVENSCKPLFSESQFYLERTDINQFVVSGNDISTAINHHNNDQHEIKVLRWFDDFWLYMKIWFVLKKGSFPRTFLTISFFQGAYEDEIKNQLFRAEWDSFDNNAYHPQPHWQIYPYKYHHKVYEDFETFNDMKNEEVGLFENNTNKIIDLRKIHFAMNAEWSRKGIAIHELPNTEVLTNWLQGLLGEIRFQLHHARGI